MTENWPSMSIADAHAALTGPGARFEIGMEQINGDAMKVWTRVPATLAKVFENGRAFGDREFLIYQDDRVTYDTFCRAAVQLAHRLREEGVVKGDRVAIVMRNLPEWAVAFYGAVLAGAIVTPLNGWWTAAELMFGLQDSGAKIVFADLERLERIQSNLDALPAVERIFVARGGPEAAGSRIVALEEVLGRPDAWAHLPDAAPPPIDFAPEDDVAILYTSGTTGNPKGAIATHRNIVSSIASAGLPAMRNLLRLGVPLPDADPHKLPQRVNLLAIPLFHATGLTGQLIIGMNAGWKVVMMHRWDVEQAMELIEREKVTSTGGVPTIAWQLVDGAEHGTRDLSSLMAVTYGGAPAAPELLRKIRQVFPKALAGSGWGMTETTAGFTTAMGRDYEMHPDSVGPAVPVSDMQIRDPGDGVSILPVGTVGELWVRGPQVVRGYWNRPQATAETFVDGWLRTGDLARLDAHGFLTIVDRAKDMVIRGGENIYCLEVENTLYDHPEVVDAAVVGIPHRTLGEEPAAVVHLSANGRVDEQALRDHVRARLAAFKVPVTILFWPDMLPRNANGKILKSELRAAVAAAAQQN